MKSSLITFGKYANKLTVIEALLNDPDWLFWAVENRAFKNWEARREAEALTEKARHIKIPKKRSSNWRVEYRSQEGDRFDGFRLVKADSSESSKWAIRASYLDLSWSRHYQRGDKRGGRRIIRDFRRYYFGGRSLTNKRAERVFSNDENCVRCKSRDP